MANIINNNQINNIFIQNPERVELNAFLPRESRKVDLRTKKPNVASPIASHSTIEAAATICKRERQT